MGGRWWKRRMRPDDERMKEVYMGVLSKRGKVRGHVSQSGPGNGAGRSEETRGWLDSRKNIWV